MSDRKGERQLKISDYAHLAGNEKERRIDKKTPLLDYIELKEPCFFHSDSLIQAGMLYEHLFPNTNERTPWDKILRTLSSISRMDSDERAWEKYSTRRYHVVLGVNDGDIVEFSMFCTLPLAADQVIAFGLYAGTADAQFMRHEYKRIDTFRGRALQASRFLIRHGVAEEDAAFMGRGEGVAGTMAETEFIGQAIEKDGIRQSLNRLQIHRRNGLLPIMLKSPGGDLMTPLIQPRLSEEGQPLLLHLLYRPLDMKDLDTTEIYEVDKKLVMELMDSYIHNYESGDYDMGHISQMRELVEDRIKAAKSAMIIPPEQMPDIIGLAKMDPLLKTQVERDFGSVDEQAARIRKVFG